MAGKRQAGAKLLEEGQKRVPGHPEVHERVVHVERPRRAVQQQHRGEVQLLVRRDEVDAPRHREVEAARRSSAGSCARLRRARDASWTCSCVTTPCSGPRPSLARPSRWTSGWRTSNRGLQQRPPAPLGARLSQPRRVRTEVQSTGDSRSITIPSTKSGEGPPTRARIGACTWLHVGPRQDVLT